MLEDRWRPKTMESIILLPRVRNIIDKYPNNNYIFYGKPGTGKTTLARILIGSYGKKACLELDTSRHTSIDVLRDKLEPFCNMVYSGLDLEVENNKDDIKWVYLNEFERASAHYQDALKGFIEENSTKNVRFVFVTNHLNKVIPAIKDSRMIKVDFDCKDRDEENFLKRAFAERIYNVIAPAENITITKKEVGNIVSKNFPDFRKTMKELDYFSKGEIYTTKENNNEQLFEHVLTEKSFVECHQFVVSNYDNSVDTMLSLLGKEFINHCINNNIHTDKLFNIVNIVANNYRLLETDADPVLIGMNVLGELKDLIYS